MSTTNGSGTQAAHGANESALELPRPSNLRHERGPEPTREILNIERELRVLVQELQRVWHVLVAQMDH